MLEKLVRLKASVLAKTAPATDPALVAYLEKVSARAYSITDEEVAGLLAAGHSEDEVFEHTVGAALGAAIERVSAGLTALAEAEKERGS